IHEPWKVLICATPSMTQTRYRAGGSSSRGVTCADFESTRSRPIWIAFRLCRWRERNLLNFRSGSATARGQREAQVQRACQLSQRVECRSVSELIQAKLKFFARPTLLPLADSAAPRALQIIPNWLMSL